MSELVVREEVPGDRSPVHAVHTAAFGREDEARLVDDLRAGASPLVSLVAEREGEVLGHILFSPVTVHGAGATSRAMGLAPLGVLPAHQHQKIGDALCRAGLEACRALGEPLVFVLGHPGYYPRFGFREAFQHGFYYREAAPNPAFMVAELEPGASGGRAGEVRYHAAFDRL